MVTPKYYLGPFGSRWVALALFTCCACAASPAPQGSIGAVLQRFNDSGAVVASEVPEGMAADRAGLVAGDRIAMVDGIYVDDLDAARLVRVLRGPVGSHVILTVIRGDEVLQLRVRREKPRKRAPAENNVENVPAVQRIE